MNSQASTHTQSQIRFRKNHKGSNGVSTVYDYDGMNRLISIANSRDGEAGRISYTYDLLGNRTKMTDESGTQLYLYDEWNRLRLINYGTGIEEHYGYDLADRVNEFILTQGMTEEIHLDYEYDKAGRVTAVSDSGVRIESAYDAAGRLESETSGFTGITARYSYAPSGSLTALRYFEGDTLLDSYEYSYDRRGNQTEKVENGYSTKYYYDPLSRIKTVEEESGDVLHYVYDDLGNIASIGEINPGGITETINSYDPCSRLISSTTANTSETQRLLFAYDSEGNQISRYKMTIRDGKTIASQEQTLLYNGYNRLSTVIDDGRITSYQYNGDGLRTSRDASGEITRYTYDRGNIVLETDGDYRISAVNVRGSHQLIYRETGDNQYFYQFNGHGDVTKLRDLSSAVIEDYSYDPYGNEDDALAPTFGGRITTALWQAEESGIDNPFRYCGKYLDLSSGFYYLRSRDYDPATKRFLTEDSYSGKAVEPLSLNLYAYCANNPINRIDPSGNTWILPTGEEANDIDRQLLDLKVQWENGDKDAARRAAELRAANQGNYHITSDMSLSSLLNNGNKHPSISQAPASAQEHWARNSFNVLPCDELWFYKHWEKYSPEMSIYHGIGINDSEVSKFVSPDGHLEAVFYGDKLMILDRSQPNSNRFSNTIVDPVNAGTYNYGTGIEHYMFDVKPYYYFGNSINDSTIEFERRNAMTIDEYKRFMYRDTSNSWYNINRLP